MTNSINEITSNKTCQGSTQNLIIIKHRNQMRSFKREESLFASNYQQAKNKNKNNTRNSNELHSGNEQTKLSSTIFPNTNLSSISIAETNEVHFNNEQSKKQKSSFLNKRENSTHKRKPHIHFRLTEEAINPIQLIETLKKSEQETIKGIAKKTINKYNTLIGIVSIVNVILSIIDLNLNILYSYTILQSNLLLNPIDRFLLIQSRSLSPEENALRIINVLLVVIAIGSIILKEKCYLAYCKSDRQLNWLEALKSFSFTNFLFEILTAIIVYPPWTNKQFIIHYKDIVYSLNLQSFAFLLNMLKMVFVIRLFTIFNPWNNAVAKAICLSYDVAPGLIFSIKSTIKYKPVLFIGIALLSLSLISESIIHSIEYSVIDNSIRENEKSYAQLTQFYHVLWFILCRASTFTFGNYRLKTYEGQVIILIITSLLWIISCFIVIKLTSQLELTTDEKKAYLKLKKLTSQENIEAKAASVLIGVIQMKKLIIERRVMESQREKTRNIMHLFVLTILISKDAKKFGDDQKTSRSLSVPVDDLLKSFETKQIDNLKVFEQSVDKSNVILDGLESLSVQQENIVKELFLLKNIQNSLANYFMNNHNSLFEANERKKAISKVKNRFKTHKIIKHQRVTSGKRVKKFTLSPKKIKKCGCSQELENENNAFCLLRPMKSDDLL